MDVNSRSSAADLLTVRGVMGREVGVMGEMRVMGEVGVMGEGWRGR